MTNTEAPDWFTANAKIYDKGEVVTNPFSGDSIELNNVELSMYDFILGAQMVISYNPDCDHFEETSNNIEKGIKWFKKVNPEAFIVLLD